jgi:protein-L-isoaspartate(D-aspartate) O-methyltransferase
MVIIFYDENRALAGQGIIGPWTGTFGWQREAKRIEVPPRAREAIIRVGMFGAVGEMSIDDVDLKAAK